VLERLVDKLRDGLCNHGRLEHFDGLKVFLLGRGDTPYAAVARE